MYTGSHLRLILTILLVPSVFVFLIAADYENRNLLSEQEITVSEIKIKDNGDDLLLTEENKVIIKRGDTFYSTLVDFGVSPTLINKIAKDKDLKEFIKLRINDEMYISKSENNLLVKRFDEDFYIDVLTITDGEYDFDKKRDNLERIVQFREFNITESLYASRGIKRFCDIKFSELNNSFEVIPFFIKIVLAISDSQNIYVKIFIKSFYQ